MEMTWISTKPTEIGGEDSTNTPFYSSIELLLSPGKGREWKGETVEPEGRGQRQERGEEGKEEGNKEDERSKEKGGRGEWRQGLGWSKKDSRESREEE
jgi:hypothetical protein